MLQAEALDQQLSAVETLERAAPDAEMQDIKALLGRMLFSGRAAHKKVRETFSRVRKRPVETACMRCMGFVLALLLEACAHAGMVSLLQAYTRLVAARQHAVCQRAADGAHQCCLASISNPNPSSAWFLIFSLEPSPLQVHVLSGGEKARLALAKFMLTRGSLLVLDEPTNHLDIPSKETLEEALCSFQGSVIAVSHDRYFLRRIATRIIAVRLIQDSTLNHYSCSGLRRLVLWSS